MSEHMSIVLTWPRLDSFLNEAKTKSAPKVPETLKNAKF